VAFDRQSIEKKDFPIGRRGYEPEAVDAHLAALAREFDALQRHVERRSGDSLATAASRHVRSIVEAAEHTAADIERQAAVEAAQIRADASVEAERIRDEAASRSYEHVARVHEATAHMLQRIDAMEGELTTLFETLRTGANRLHADLSLLQGNMGELSGSGGEAAQAPPAEEPAYAALEADDDLAEDETAVELDWSELAPTASDQREERVEEPLPFSTPPEPEPEPARRGASGGGDVEGARLVALNMALNGQPREEADRYLAENFDLPDRSALLDDVYAAVGG
jgi:DivIVA domain-containing protein